MRQAAGTEPTTTTRSSRPSAATITVAPTTAMKTPGTRGATRRRPSISTSDPAPRASAVALVSSRPGDEVAHAAHEALGVDREAEQLGQLLDDDRHGDAHQVAEAHGQRQQLGDEAEARQPAGEHDAPRRGWRACPARAIRSDGVAARCQRDDRGGDERRRPPSPGPGRGSATGPAGSRRRAARAVAYSPVTGGTPASSAYAMPCGTRRAARTGAGHHVAAQRGAARWRRTSASAGTQRPRPCEPSSTAPP